MATTLKYSFSFFVILMMLSSIFIATEAGRDPFNIKMKSRNSAASKVIEGFFDGLYLGAIKDSGPSPGVGHKLFNGQTLGGIKDSGPSPGDGHKHVTGTHE